MSCYRRERPMRYFWYLLIALRYTLAIPAGFLSSIAILLIAGSLWSLAGRPVAGWPTSVWVFVCIAGAVFSLAMLMMLPLDGRLSRYVTALIGSICAVLWIWSDFGAHQICQDWSIGDSTRCWNIYYGVSSFVDSYFFIGGAILGSIITPSGWQGRCREQNKAT